jgi:excisionase family DNA binding protein
MRFTRPRAGHHDLSEASDWLALSEASQLLGVAPGTLRRWSDEGRVKVFTTPGGHRRYRRAALERLLPGTAGDRPSLARSGMTQTRLVRAYRQEARSAARHMPWLVALDEEQRAWFRDHGRRLAEQLLAHLDARDAESVQQHLQDATAEAAAYGEMAAGLRVSLSQAVEGFLQFRRPFLHELVLVARRRGFDTGATTDLIEAAERAMDALLVAAMAAHGGGTSVSQTGPRRRARIAPAAEDRA